MTDTDQYRAVVRKLTDALYDYLTLEIDAYERMAKAGMLPAYATAPKAESFEDQLIKAAGKRSEVFEKIVEAEEQIDASPELMRGGLTLACLNPLKENLAYWEAEMSRLQALLEKEQEKPTAALP